MRFLTFLFLALVPIFGYAQPNTVIANRTVVKDSIQLGADWITGIEKDTTLAGATDKLIPTARAVKKYVDAIVAAISGVTDGDKGDIDVIDDGETWTIDTSAVTSIKIATDAVTQAKIANNSVGSGELINKELTPGTYGSATESVRITVDADGRLDSVSVVDISGGLVLTDTFNAALDLTRNAYLLAYTQSDTIRFTVADTTIGRWNAARISSTGEYPLYFDGAGWDASGFFNIVDGGILPLGNHTIYFESTPYGVMCSVPSNYNPESPGSGEFSPLSLTDCRIWLDGKDTASIVVSGTTTTWQDKSGNGRNATNAISSEQPTKSGSGWVQFTTNDGLGFSSIGFASADPHTITLVIDPDAITDNVILGTPSGTFFQLRPTSTVLYGNNSFAHLVSTSPQVLQLVYTGSSGTAHQLYVNDVQVATDTELSARAIAMLGQYGSNPSSFGYSGKVYALTIHGAALNETERAQLFEYFNTRHGLGL